MSDQPRGDSPMPFHELTESIRDGIQRLLFFVRHPPMMQSYDDDALRESAAVRYQRESDDASKALARMQLLTRTGAAQFPRQFSESFCRELDFCGVGIERQLPPFGPCGAEDSEAQNVVHRLQRIQDELLVMSRNAACGSPAMPELIPPDGPESPDSLWWEGKRYNLGAGVLWRLLRIVWDIRSIPFDDLMGQEDKPWRNLTNDGAVKTCVNRLNTKLPGSLTWKLRTADRCVMKVFKK